MVLVGDTGYSPSPASGQGTSLALVGAYVLAGELKAAGDDHHIAYARYEDEMPPYVARNLVLGQKMIKEWCLRRHGRSGCVSRASGRCATCR